MANSRSGKCRAALDLVSDMTLIAASYQQMRFVC